MASVILAPVNWNTPPVGTGNISSRQKSFSHSNLRRYVWKRVAEESVGIAEKTGYFLNVDRNFIISQYVNCPLPETSPLYRGVRYIPSRMCYLCLFIIFVSLNRTDQIVCAGKLPYSVYVQKYC